MLIVSPAFYCFVTGAGLNTTVHKKISKLGLSICVLASLFYVYDFTIRIIPGTIFHYLLSHFSINAAGLGLLSSFFFLGYLIMQIPCGLLYDRFGPRLVMTCTMLLAAVSTWVFLATDNFTIAFSARFLMGVGAAFAYIGPLVLVSRWLPKRYYALSAGIIQFMGSMGAILGETPVAHLVKHFGAWPVVQSLALIGVALALLFAVFIRNSPGKSKPISANQQANHIFAPLLKTLKKPQNWITAFYGFCIWAPISIFAALWAVPYFKDTMNINTSEAAFIASFIWLGVALGGPCLGMLSNHFHSRCKPLILASSLGLAASLLILFLPHLSISTVVLCFIFGFASSSQAVTFGLVYDNNRLQNIGTASAFNNMAIVFGGVIFQPIVGLILQWSSEHSRVVEKAQHFTHSDYMLALSIIPLCYILALLTVKFLVKETNNQPAYSNQTA